MSYSISKDTARSMKHLIVPVLILLSISTISSVTVEEKKYTYSALVVEYFQQPSDDFAPPEEIVQRRTRDYIELVANIGQEVDIVVFPESTLLPRKHALTLSSQVPRAFEKIICNSSDDEYEAYLKDFSCAAIRFNTTIVIDTVEKEVCRSGACGGSGTAYYNSAVVFNEEGYVSGRYRKFNRFGEFHLQSPPEADIVTITTNDNDTFGIFICFDVLFSTPAMELIGDRGIQNIVFPHCWFGELPYLTALQVQQMWAEEYNVNFLSAGCNNPSQGSGGSGIFVGDQGPLAARIVSGKGGTEGILRRVPRPNIQNNPFREFPETDYDVDALAKEMDSFHLITDLSINKHTSVVLDVTKRNVVEEVCNGDEIKLCCLFNLTITSREIDDTSKNRYVYHLAVFNGVRSFSGLRELAIESCAVMACLNHSVSSCGQRFPDYDTVAWPLTFDAITVSASFPAGPHRAQFPNSLLASLRPVPPRHAHWTAHTRGGRVERSHASARRQDRLLTFGIYGRHFARDGPTAAPERSAGAAGAVGVVVFHFIIFYRIFSECYSMRIFHMNIL